MDLQPPTLTLDTNILIEFWSRQQKLNVVEALLQLAKQGKVDLAVTARIQDDIPRPPLADRINELPLLNIVQTGSVTRLGAWVLGRDMLGDQSFVDFVSNLEHRGTISGKKQPDWRDWDHLHAHYLLRRNTFLTWDNRILGFAEALKSQFGINIMTPEDYLANSNLS